MQQLEIEYFFPLTEQIPLGLDYEPSIAYAKELNRQRCAEQLALSGEYLIANGTGGVSWQNPPVGNTLVNGSYSVTLNSDGSLQSSPGSFVLRCDDIAGADSRVTLNGNQSIMTASSTGVGSAPSATVETDGALGVVTLNTSNSITSTNYNLTLNADGTVTFPASGASGNPARIQTTSANFQVNANGGIFDFNSSGTLQTPYFTLPGSIGTSGQVLAVPSSGSTLVWTTPAAGTITSVTGGGHITANTVGGAVTLGSDATNANTASTIVARDASGNFSAGTITAALNGNASTATSATSATTATTATQVSNALTAGTGITYSSGTTYNGSAAITISIPQAVGTASNVQFGSFGVGTAASGTTGEIRATNNVTAYYSDERLKTKTGDIENALEKVKQIETMYYHANETAVALGYDSSIQEVGVTAQSVQRVMPQTVAPAPIDDKYLTVRYERLVPLLIEAIKELEAQVAELKAK